MKNNGFYKITEYLMKIAEGIELNNTVIFAQSEDKDLYKNNVYPLIHLNPTTSPLSISNGATSFTFEIGVLDKRIQDNKGQDKIDGNFNIIDTFATTSAIVNEYISDINRNIGSEFTLESITDATPIYYEDNNGLDGWVFQLTIQIANNVDFC